jgi:transposase
LEQSVFSCTKCSHPENADLNTAKVIKSRGIKVVAKHLEAVIAGTLEGKVKRTVRVRGSKDSKKHPKVGQVLPEQCRNTAA